MSQIVDEAVLLGERHEPRRANGAELRVVPADQRLDLGEAAVAHRDLWLIDHVQGLALERQLEAVDQPQFGLRAHCTSVDFSLERISSSTSNRTGFSIGPTI